MRDVIQAATHALSNNDAGTLERLAREVGTGEHAISNVAESQQAAAVLSAQLSAAAANITLRSRILAAEDFYRATPWER